MDAYGPKRERGAGGGCDGGEEQQWAVRLAVHGKAGGDADERRKRHRILIWCSNHDAQTHTPPFTLTRALAPPYIAGSWSGTKCVAALA